MKQASNKNEKDHNHQNNRFAMNFRLPKELQQQTVPLDDGLIQQAYQQSQQMAKKLKHIRTALGYQQEPTKIPPQHLETRKEGFKEDRSLSLRNFVLEMRRKSQRVYNTLEHKRGNTISYDVNERENSNVQQYTNASLKYIHSFLPHASFIETAILKRKKEKLLREYSHSVRDSYNAHGKELKPFKANSQKHHFRQESIELLKENQHILSNQDLGQHNTSQNHSLNKSFETIKVDPECIDLPKNMKSIQRQFTIQRSRPQGGKSTETLYKPKHQRIAKLKKYREDKTSQKHENHSKTDRIPIVLPVIVCNAARKNSNG